MLSEGLSGSLRPFHVTQSPLGFNPSVASITDPGNLFCYSLVCIIDIFVQNTSKSKSSHVLNVKLRLKIIWYSTPNAKLKYITIITKNHKYQTMGSEDAKPK